MNVKRLITSTLLFVVSLTVAGQAQEWNEVVNKVLAARPGHFQNLKGANLGWSKRRNWEHLWVATIDVPGTQSRCEIAQATGLATALGGRPTDATYRCVLMHSSKAETERVNSKYEEAAKNIRAAIPSTWRESHAKYGGTDLIYFGPIATEKDAVITLVFERAGENYPLESSLSVRFTESFRTGPAVACGKFCMGLKAVLADRNNNFSKFRGAKAGENDFIGEPPLPTNNTCYLITDDKIHYGYKCDNTCSVDRVGEPEVCHDTPLDDDELIAEVRAAIPADWKMTKDGDRFWMFGPKDGPTVIWLTEGSLFVGIYSS